ncbi:hypothetical protein EJB05_40599, partial [Eragrostis curvula]
MEATRSWASSSYLPLAAISSKIKGFLRQITWENLTPLLPISARSIPRSRIDCLLLIDESKNEVKDLKPTQKPSPFIFFPKPGKVRRCSELPSSLLARWNGLKHVASDEIHIAITGDVLADDMRKV